MILLSGLVKFSIVNTDPPLSIIFQNYDKWRHQVTIRNQVYEISVKEFLQLFFDYLLMCGVHSVLSLPNWFAVLVKVNAVNA